MSTMIKLIAESLILATPNMNNHSRIELLRKALESATAINDVLDSFKTVRNKFKDVETSVDSFLKSNPLGSIVRTPNPSTAIFPDPVQVSQRTIDLAKSGAVVKTPETRSLFVNIRVHPSGVKQPLGYRKVTKMEFHPGNIVRVGVLDGTQGWDFDANMPGPHWLDFVVGGPGGQKLTLNEAVQFWKNK